MKKLWEKIPPPDDIRFQPSDSWRGCIREYLHISILVQTELKTFEGDKFLKGTKILKGLRIYKSIH